jgi:hypothetical protein
LIDTQQKNNKKMSQLKNMSILLVIAFAATMLQNTEAVDHIVGGSTGWTATPPGGASFYSDWASNITFKENDVLGEFVYMF